MLLLCFSHNLIFLLLIKGLGHNRFLFFDFAHFLLLFIFIFALAHLALIGKFTVIKLLGGFKTHLELGTGLTGIICIDARIKRDFYRLSDDHCLLCRCRTRIVVFSGLLGLRRALSNGIEAILSMSASLRFFITKEQTLTTVISTQLNYGLSLFR